MPSKPDGWRDSTHADDWFRYAIEDFEAMRALGDRHLRQASFLLQQAAEKGLKAFLLSKGEVLHRTHDLDALLDRAVELHAPLERHREVCEEVTLYYIQERYPGEHRYLPNPGEFRRNAERVELLIQDLRDASGP